MQKKGLLMKITFFLIVEYMCEKYLISYIATYY